MRGFVGGGPGWNTVPRLHDSTTRDAAPRHRPARRRRASSPCASPPCTSPPCASPPCVVAALRVVALRVVALRVAALRSSSLARRHPCRRFARGRRARGRRARGRPSVALLARRHPFFLAHFFPLVLSLSFLTAMGGRGGPRTRVSCEGRSVTTERTEGLGRIVAESADESS
jgi:hypothetical protein